MVPIISHKPREQVRRSGVRDLTLEQAVALIIGSGTHQVPVADLSLRVAREIRKGNVSYQDLLSLPGLGPAKAGALVGALSLSYLASDQSSIRPILTPEAVYAECLDLITKPQEHLVVFLLNVRNKLISRETITIGTATASMVHPREVFREAILQNSHTLVLAHNHPSGDATPSRADLEVTRQLSQAGRVLGIELLDHVICARSGWHSLKDTNPELFR